MSRFYECTLIIHNSGKYRHSRLKAIKMAAVNQWPFRVWDVEEDDQYEGAEMLFSTARDSLYGGEEENAFSARLVHAIWSAAKEYVDCEIIMAFLEDPPIETYLFDKDNYEQWSANNEASVESGAGVVAEGLAVGY